MDKSKEIILQMFQRIQKGTEYVLQAIPEDKLEHRVSDNSASVKELAFHIATLPLGAALFAQNIFDKFPDNETLMNQFEKYLGDSLKNNDYPEMFRKSCQVCIEFFKQKDWINETFANFLNKNQRTYLEAFLSMQNHLIQHRGSLVSTLRSAGIPVSMQQYWGMKPLTPE
ncbi:MAG: hypothetical protein D6732_14830 [Methanobacteriota archaeon]|nr:MAG: hypothetical protein D6732_14830 [Euryarchaeota archaeon]